MILWSARLYTSLVNTAGTENILMIDSVASLKGPPKRMPSGGSRELRFQVHAVPSGNEVWGNHAVMPLDVLGRTVRNHLLLLPIRGHMLTFYSALH